MEGALRNIVYQKTRRHILKDNDLGDRRGNLIPFIEEVQSNGWALVRLFLLSKAAENVWLPATRNCERWESGGRGLIASQASYFPERKKYKFHLYTSCSSLFCFVSLFSFFCPLSSFLSLFHSSVSSSTFLLGKLLLLLAAPLTFSRLSSLHSSFYIYIWLRGLTPRANYTDRATTAFRRS
jgi:hypothetical protein